MNKKPNILFIFSDQQHSRAVGHKDSFFHTPVLDRFSSDAVGFNQAFCTTPQCSPSRSSMLTGFYPSKTGVLGNIDATGGNPLAMPTIGKLLQQAGYYTGYFGKWHLGKNPLATAGWDESSGVIGNDQNDDELATRQAMQFLNNRQSNTDQPFALIVSLINPHDVYHWRKATDQVPDDVPLPPTCHPNALDHKPTVQRQFMTDDQGKQIYGQPTEQWQKYRVCYRTKVEDFDRNCGRILDRVQSAGQYDESVIIVTSDHGDLDTHHGMIFKGPCMYEQLLKVPAYVRLPSRWGGRRGRSESNCLTVNVDWVPTLMQLAGVDAPACDGMSLLPILRGEKNELRSFVVGEYFSKQTWVNPIRSIRTENAKYVRYRSGEQEYYDLMSDPDEAHNRINDPAYINDIRALAGQLDQWMASRGDDFETHLPTDRSGKAL